MPEHADVKDNGCADRLADLAIVRGGIEMDRTDILNVSSDNYSISEAVNNSESTPMIWLHEPHVKAGSARQQQYAGRQRSIVNQHKTGNLVVT
jgi:hypothetical protein